MYLSNDVHMKINTEKGAVFCDIRIYFPVLCTFVLCF